MRIYDASGIYDALRHRIYMMYIHLAVPNTGEEDDYRHQNLSSDARGMVADVAHIPTTVRLVTFT